MGYAGVRGGQEAIVAAERLVAEARFGGGSGWLELGQITERLSAAVDRVMGEGGLWAPELAARAFRQAQGDVLEAAQLLRAHRSTLPRLGYGLPVGTRDLRAVRRISPAVRQPPGGQLLGRTTDYTPRVLDLTPDEQLRTQRPARSGRGAATASPRTHDAIEPDAALRAEGLLADRRVTTDPDPYDITRAPARPGAPRSARLSAMARAETGSLTHLWYMCSRAPRHDGPEIPLELRRGRLPLRVRHPHTGRPVVVAAARVTEARTVRPTGRPRTDGTRFDTGYGLCFGENEPKALAMAGLDLLVHRDPHTDRLEQKVLIALDGPEASGFLEHLKLPHYVDFRSTMERVQAVRAAAGGAR
ncbi:carbon-phosphorus lyase complex subunit PhnI [Streptomyces zagrosensis]|uniref:Alpha-D-ribose 1-methylphosphonate 5-triphosphate synthase subunit PhnI n=1 Tax=Streptomyces zagrosensis TaxID=1042984 RepID=A0A7W9QA52_9ACTN|nr:carbon-phosphorus lyase complex subunit PhnI [Streptomyces zagrosensis]MBB5935472.1 alpha-D-ribose 1-methylphosphonate 5-triphosphate synthase subunit PhnI [Streptomyces zagrosensis]